MIFSLKTVQSVLFSLLVSLLVLKFRNIPNALQLGWLMQFEIQIFLKTNFSRVDRLRGAPMCNSFIDKHRITEDLQ